MLANPHWQRQHCCRLSMREVMIIIVLFHLSHYRTFRDYYYECVLQDMRAYFPALVIYNRFVGLMRTVFLPLLTYLVTHKGKPTGYYYVDSTDSPVCHHRRLYQHQIFQGIAERGKTSVD